MVRGCGAPFIIWADHKNLTYLRTTKRLNACQVCWFLLFRRFNFSISYHPGSCNVKTNALSREIIPDTGQPEPANILPTTCQVGAFTWGIKAIRQTLQEEPNPGKGHPAKRCYVPTAACLAVIPWSHTARFTCHPRVSRTISFLKHYFWWNTLKRDSLGWNTLTQIYQQFTHLLCHWFFSI